MELSENPNLNLLLARLGFRPQAAAMNALELASDTTDRYNQFAALVDPTESIYNMLLNNDPEPFLDPVNDSGRDCYVDKHGQLHDVTISCQSVTPRGIDLTIDGHQSGWRLTISKYAETKTDVIVGLGDDSVTSHLPGVAIYDLMVIDDAAGSRMHESSLYSLTSDEEGASLTPQRAELPGNMTLDEADQLSNPQVVSASQFEASIQEYRRLLWQIAADATPIAS